MSAGYCPRCGTIVTTSHSKPECDARYDAKYGQASGPSAAWPDGRFAAAAEQIVQKRILTAVAGWKERAIAAEATLARVREILDAEARCEIHGAQRSSDCHECRIVLEIETYDEVLRAALNDGTPDG